MVESVFLFGNSALVIIVTAIMLNSIAQSCFSALVPSRLIHKDRIVPPFGSVEELLASRFLIYGSLALQQALMVSLQGFEIDDGLEPLCFHFI